MGSGKSWRTTGILYVFDACSTKGAVRRHIGHCKSSKTTIATCAPLGGRSTVLRASCAGAGNAAPRTMNAADNRAKRIQSLFFIISYVSVLLLQRSSWLDARNLLAATWDSHRSDPKRHTPW